VDVLRRMESELYNFCEACEEIAGLYENCNTHAWNGPPKKSCKKARSLQIQKQLSKFQKIRRLSKLIDFNNSIFQQKEKKEKIIVKNGGAAT